MWEGLFGKDKVEFELGEVVMICAVMEGGIFLLIGDGKEASIVIKIFKELLDGVGAFVREDNFLFSFEFHFL